MKKSMTHTRTSVAEELTVEQPPMAVAGDYVAAVVSEEQQVRASAYNLLASLLRRAPDEALLAHVAGFANLQSEADEVALSLSVLGLSAGSASVGAVDDEFHQLFIGIGRGELVPYGAWYQTGFLMEKPLSLLRDDLKALGFVRDDSVKEPEDHVAALCEVMAMLILDDATHALQVNFFEKHLASWIARFFNDLAQARSADFYRAVGRFGRAFCEFEAEYLSMQV